MKKYKIFFLCLLLFLPISVCAQEFDFYSKYMILYNLDENTILYQKDSEEEISIASMTKIMTAIVAIENIDSLEETILLTREDFSGLKEANASVAGFFVGQKVTYLDLLYGLLLPSGADAAQALTRNVTKTREQFVFLMNEKAKMLGLEHTHFENETGLDQKGHYSTVKDVATLFMYALQNETFQKIISTKTYETSDHRLQFQSTAFKNITKYGLKMDYFVGGKTGTTYDAGLCLASIATYNGVSYMLVTAGAPYPSYGPHHLVDAKTIYEYYMANFENKILVEKEEPLISISTDYGKQKEITFYAEEEIKKYLPLNFSKQDLTYSYEGLDQISANTKIGTYVGTMNLLYQGEILASIALYLNETIEFSLVRYLWFYKEQILILISIVFLLLLIFHFLKQKKRKNLSN